MDLLVKILSEVALAAAALMVLGFLFHADDSTPKSHRNALTGFFVAYTGTDAFLLFDSLNPQLGFLAISAATLWVGYTFFDSFTDAQRHNYLHNRRFWLCVGISVIAVGALIWLQVRRDAEARPPAPVKTVAADTVAQSPSLTERELRAKLDTTKPYQP